MTMILDRRAMRIGALACAAFAFLAPSSATAARKHSHAKPHITKPPDALFTKAEMEHMTYTAFKAAYRNRGGDVTPSGLDNAAIYYANIKAQIHDHEAKKISADALGKLRKIRTQLFNGDIAAFDARWVPNTKPNQQHIWTRWCTEREDAVGGMLTALRKPGKATKSKQSLLSQIEGLDGRLKPRQHPFHDLAKVVANLPDNVLALIVKHEEHTAATVLSTPRNR